MKSSAMRRSIRISTNQCKLSAWRAISSSIPRSSPPFACKQRKNRRNKALYQITHSIKYKIGGRGCDSYWLLGWMDVNQTNVVENQCSHITNCGTESHMMERDGEQYLHEEVKQRIKATMTSSIQALFAYINCCVVLGDILPQHSRDKCLHFSSGFIIRPFCCCCCCFCNTNENENKSQHIKCTTKAWHAITPSNHVVLSISRP